MTIAIAMIAGDDEITAKVVDAAERMRTIAKWGVGVDGIDRDAAAAKGMQTAVFAGGCFWGIQAVYQHTRGVTNAVSGYAGGDKADADYRNVSGGMTKHAEAVKITFDPKVISYGKILQIFFSVAHNPTELDRQGPDHGPQYRSEIFPQNDEQATIAKAYIAQLDAAKAFKDRIVTKTGTMKAAFYPAAPEWRRAVLEQSKVFIDQGVAGVAAS